MGGEFDPGVRRRGAGYFARDGAVREFKLKISVPTVRTFLHCEGCLGAFLLGGAFATFSLEDGKLLRLIVDEKHLQGVYLSNYSTERKAIIALCPDYNSWPGKEKADQAIVEIDQDTLSPKLITAVKSSSRWTMVGGDSKKFVSSAGEVWSLPDVVKLKDGIWDAIFG